MSLPSPDAHVQGPVHALARWENRRAWFAIPLALSMLVGMFAILAVAAAPPAAADGCHNEAICVAVGGEGDVDLDNWDPPPPGCTSNCGGSGQETPTNTWYDPESGLFAQNRVPPADLRNVGYGGKGVTSWSVSRPYNNACGTADQPKKHRWTTVYAGDKRSYAEPLKGWTYTRGGTFTVQESGAVDYTMTWGGFGCIKPPTYAETDVVCVVQATDTLWGPVGTPDFPNATWYDKKGTVRSQRYDDGIQTPKNPSAGVYRSDWYFDKENATKCEKGMEHTSGEFDAERNPLVTGKYHLGQWQLESVLQLQNCTYRDWRPADLEDRIRPSTCGVPYTPPADLPRIVVRDTVEFSFVCSSPNVILEHQSGLSYTMADCQPTTWVCKPDAAFSDQQGSLNGVEGSLFTFLGDGKTRSASWAWPEPTGNVYNIKDRTAWLDVIAGSSPMRPGNKNGDTQPYKFDPGLGNLMPNGWQNDPAATKSVWDFGFFAAGSPGQPFKVQPRWTFTGTSDLRFPTKPLSEWDGNPEHTGWITIPIEDKFTCDGAPMQFNVYKPRIASN